MKTLGIKPECFLFEPSVEQPDLEGVVYVAKSVSESTF